MTEQNARRLVQLADQLVEMVMAAAICVQEIAAEARMEFEDDGIELKPVSGHGHCHAKAAARRPLLDRSTLCVIWKDKSLHLGHTRAFWVLDRLSRRPNQYVTHLDLLRDVWDDEDLPTATIRSSIRHLRRKLHAGGMGELAAAIRGHNGHYVLVV